jgi:TolB-like protein
MIKLMGRDLYFQLTDAETYKFTNFGDANITDNMEVAQQVVLHIQSQQQFSDGLSKDMVMEIVTFEDYDIIRQATRLKTTPKSWNPRNISNLFDAGSG